MGWAGWVEGPGHQWGAAHVALVTHRTCLSRQQLYSMSFNFQRAGCFLEPNTSCCSVYRGCVLMHYVSGGHLRWVLCSSRHTYFFDISGGRWKARTARWVEAGGRGQRDAADRISSSVYRILNSKTLTRSLIFHHIWKECALLHIR